MFNYKKRYAVAALVAYIILAFVIFGLALQTGDSSGKLSQAVYAFFAGINLNHEKIYTDEEQVDIASIELSHNSRVYSVGQAAALKVTVLPENHTEEVCFYSTDESVAKVNSNGVITFLAPGKVSVYAKNKSGTVESARLDFSVYDKADISSLDKNKVEISFPDELPTNTAKTIGLKYDGVPLKISYELKSDDTSVFETKGAYVLTRGAGQATIELYFNNELLATKQLTVTHDVLEEPRITAVNVGEQSDGGVITLYLGKTYTIGFELENEDTATKSYLVQPKTDDEDILKAVRTGYAESGSVVAMLGEKCVQTTLAVYSRTNYEEEIFSFDVIIVPPPAVAVAINKPETDYQVGLSYTPQLVVADKSSLVGYDFTVEGKDYTKDGDTVVFNAVGEYQITFNSIYYPENEYKFTVLVFDVQAQKTVRKSIGHFGLFAMLGFIGVFWAFRFFKKLPYNAIIDLFAGFLVAFVSEFLQLSFFTSARAFSILDILLDFGGYVLGTAVALGFVYVVYKIILRRRASSPTPE